MPTKVRNSLPFKYLDEALNLTILQFILKQMRNSKISHVSAHLLFGLRDLGTLDPFLSNRVSFCACMIPSPLCRVFGSCRDWLPRLLTPFTSIHIFMG